MDQLQTLAFIDPGVIAVMIPIVALMIPIVAMLTKHQRSMAELIHGSQQTGAVSHELAAMRHEIAELRQLVHQQAIAMDSWASLKPPQQDLGSRPGQPNEG